MVNRKALYGQATAQSYCQKLGGNLTSFRTADESAKFVREVGFTTTDYEGMWIGLSAPSATDDKSAFTWISTGQSPDFPGTSGGSWGSEPTEQPTGTNNCVIMADQYGYWEDKDCMAAYGFTCELRKCTLLLC